MNGIMEESLVAWELNGVPQAPILCNGQDVEALLIGHLITAGLVRFPDQIRSVACRENFWHVVTERQEKAICDPVRRLKAFGVNPSEYKIPWKQLDQLCAQVMALDNSAGLHAVLLSDSEHTVIGRDVGRHNALDKAVGKAMKEGMAFSQAALCSSGRLSLEMLVKAAAAGIPILATRKQVGSLCVACAADMNIAVCRVGNDPIAYSAGWRVF